MKTIFLLAFMLVFFPEISESGGLKKKLIKKSTPKTPAPPAIETPTESHIRISDDPYEQCKATVLPSFINFSMGWGDPKYKVKFGPFKTKIDAGLASYRAFDSLSPPAVMVAAAENSHPKPLDPLKVKASKDKNFNMILVGNLGPSGHKWPDSQEGEEVHISAPSANFLTSSNNDGHYRRFGGTSGAAPLVTGALAGFEWLSGYHPTAEESKILLEKTAIKTPISLKKPRKNGAGMLNSYKMAMVGEELKRLCGKNISCFKQNIKNPAIYKFPEDPSLTADVQQAFPECSQECGGTEESCKNKAEVFKRLRKESLLNPSNRVAYRQLACIYKNSGLRKNAQGAFNTYKALTPDGPACQQDAHCILVPDCPRSHSFGLDSSSQHFSEAEGSGVVMSKGALKDVTKTNVNRPPFRSMTKAQAETYKLANCSREQLCQYPPDIHGGPHKKKVEGKTYISECVNSSCVVTEEIPAKLKPSTTPAESSPANPQGSSSPAEGSSQPASNGSNGQR